MSRSLAALVVMFAGAGCEMPFDEEEGPVDIEEVTGQTLSQPGDEVDGFTVAFGEKFVDTECGDKHKRHPLETFTYKGARYIREGNVETFDHVDYSCNRVEIDTNTHYRAGKHTFQGDVKVVRPGKEGKTSVVQLFHGKRGAVLMIRGFNASGGSLRSPGGGPTYATNILNDWVNIKIVHDLPGNKLTIFANGKQIKSGGASNDGTAGFNIKYGNYGTGAPTSIQWRNATWD